MSITVETIAGYFEQYGWSYDQLSETDFRTGFRGDVSIFRIIVHIADNWVYFSISPFVVAPQDPECERMLYKHLLHLNHEINMAKFTIDQDGDVIRVDVEAISPRTLDFDVEEETQRIRDFLSARTGKKIEVKATIIRADVGESGASQSP